MLQSRRLGIHPPLQRASQANANAFGFGEKGEHVAALQDLLADLGMPFSKSRKSGKFDGIFGEETRKAVRLFQAQYGLKQDGIVGPKTLAALDKLIRERPHLESPAEDQMTKERFRDYHGPGYGKRLWHD